MTEPLDLLKSLVRQAADRLAQAEAGGWSWSSLRQRLVEATQLQRTITASELTNIVAHAPEVTEASVTVTEEALQVEVTTSRGSLSFALRPQGVRFAPRGAKELRFQVEPSTHASDDRALNVVRALSAHVGQILWGTFIREGWDPTTVTLDTQGSTLIADLRSLAALRALGPQNPKAAIIELLDVRQLHLHPGRLLLEVDPFAALQRG